MSYPPKEFWNVEKITIPATAGNVAYDITPGDGYRYILLYGSITLVTDATVANRTITTTPRNAAAAQIGLSLQNLTAITASLTRVVSFFNKDIGDFADTRGFTLWNDVGYVLLHDVIDGTDLLRITINSGVAGDSYSGSFRAYKIKM